MRQHALQLPSKPVILSAYLFLCPLCLSGSNSRQENPDAPDSAFVYKRRTVAKTTLRSIAAILLILLAGMSTDSQACNVPAFRYALERWPADPYQILVYYKISPQSQAFELLQKSAIERNGTANYSLKGIDVTKPEGKALAEQREIVATPWVEVFYPVHFQVRTPVWSGPLTSDRVKSILDSPIRSGIAQKLLGGEVAVWMLIKSGHEQKDARARQALKTNLERASATLRIPEIGTDLNGNPIAVTDFKTYPVHFGLMEIARDDRDEKLLVSALLKSESDLGQYDEPMAFPVFGRGRALYALVGDGIQEKTILEACQSMVNWCSCEIKALNPGTDLLISADWSRPYGGKIVQDPQLPLTGLSGFAQDQATAEVVKTDRKADPVEPAAVRKVAPTESRAAGSVPIGAPAQAPRSSENLLVRNVLYLAGAVGLVLVTLSILVMVKRKNRL
jgi:hypothetical protein